MRTAYGSFLGLQVSLLNLLKFFKVTILVFIFELVYQVLYLIDHHLLRFFAVIVSTQLLQLFDDQLFLLGDLVLRLNI